MNRSALLRSAATAALLIFSSAAFAQSPSGNDTGDATTAETITLDPIHLFFGWIATLGNGEISDTGSTVIGVGSINVRSDGSGDPNTALTSLPTVQYRNDTDSDAGVNLDDILNLQPLEVSIAGARVDENNFMLDGVGINSLGSSDNPYELSAGSLSRETGSPNLYAIYGSHSQSQFVPESLLEGAEILDSNVSAQYGGFQGGVVNYQLKKPRLDKASGGVSLSYQDDSLTHYRLGTEAGENPLGRDKPEWRKLRLSFYHNQPLNERTAVFFGFDRARVQGRKQKDAQYIAGSVESETQNDFYRLGLLHKADIGTFGLTLNLTDYSQNWDSNYSRDMRMNIDTLSKSVTGTFSHEFGPVLAARNVKLDLSATYQNNRAGNDYNSNLAYNWLQRVHRSNWEATTMSDWCQSVINGTANTTCRAGGYGDRMIKDEQLDLSATLSGDLWAGRFSTGLSYSHAKAIREFEGYSLYTVGTNATLARKRFSAFTCAAGDASCTAEQYASVLSYQPGNALEVDANKIGGWLELSQNWGDFDLRSGLRVDYNDVLNNWDVAPRLTGSWRASENLTLTLGFNRYYSDNWIGYSIHDNLPRPTTFLRSASARGLVGDWVQSNSNASYRYSGSGLDTPYNDEITVGVTYEDLWSGGLWRLRYIQRDGKDQFARSEASTGLNNVLTNDGWSEYESFVLEYTKNWKQPAGSSLDQIGLYITGAWAERRISNSSYFGNNGTSGAGIYYWYNNRSYDLSEFSVVTGNMDIPVRATVELRGSWLEGKYELGIGADVAFGYRGVVDTDREVIASHADGYTGAHYLFEDHDFEATVAMNLSAKIRLAQRHDNNLDLNIKVANLLDDLGNRTASNTNPWMPGRSFALSLNYTW